MKSFTQWCEENKKDLSVLTDVEPTEADVDKGDDTTDENRTRTGAGPHYPDAYVRAQYPWKYFNPTLSTADLDLANAKKKK